jgi:hypothetical protein
MPPALGVLALGTYVVLTTIQVDAAFAKTQSIRVPPYIGTQLETLTSPAILETTGL